VGINSAPAFGAALTVSGRLKASSAEFDSMNVATLVATAVSGFGTVPLGGIIIWSGAENAVPAGWALCNGQTSNGRTTPNLQGRFVIGPSSGRGVGVTGGAESVTLTVGQLPAHNHRVSGQTASAGNHAHRYDDIYYSEGGGPNGNLGWLGSGKTDRDNGPHFTSRNTDSAGDHSHSFDVTSASTGSGQAVSIMPPFYALAYIMRVQ
jgi:microcystin-dependent protein